MIKTIPSRSETYCDVCGVLCDNSSFGRGSRKQQGQLHLKRTGLDYLGDPACDATITRDLCDHCLVRISEAINTEAEKIKTEEAP